MSGISGIYRVALCAIAVLALPGCGSNDASRQATATTADTAETTATSPGKPMPNAAIVRTEAIQAMQEGSELRISVTPKEGVRLVSISFPAEPRIELIRQEIDTSVTGKPIARHLFDLDVNAGAEQQEFTALLQLESNGKRFGQLVRIPLQPGVATARDLPKPSPDTGDDMNDDMDGQSYPVKEMPAEQEIIRD